MFKAVKILFRTGFVLVSVVVLGLFGTFCYFGFLGLPASQDSVDAQTVYDAIRKSGRDYISLVAPDARFELGTYPTGARYARAPKQDITHYAVANDARRSREILARVSGYRPPHGEDQYGAQPGV